MAKNMMSKITSWRILSLVTWITVEPIQFLYCVMFSISSIVRDNLFIDKVCLLDLEYSPDVCYNLTHKKQVPKEMSDAVQSKVAELAVYDGVLVALPSVLFCLFVGAWSDVNGRKLLLIIPFIGNILSFVAYGINEYFFYELSSLHLLWGSVVGLSGSYICLNLGLYGYLSDVTTSEDRTMRCTWLGLLFTAFIKRGFFNLDNLKESVMTSIKWRPNSGRFHVILLVLNFAIFMFCLNTNHYDYLLVINKYQWDVADFSYYLSIQRICRFVGLFLLLPFLSKILKFSDALIASVGTILTIVAYVLMATGTEDWLGPNGDWPKGWIMYLSAVFQLNSIITVAIRSQCTKEVEPNEIGRIFAVVALGQALVPLVSNPLFGGIYKATLSSYPGTYLLVIAGMLLFVLFSSTLMFFNQRRQHAANQQLIENEN